MGNVMSLIDQPEEETYTPRYNNDNPQQYQTQHPLYTTRYTSAPYHGMLTSTEEESTRQSYEQSRHERSKRIRDKRKELELEQEEYERKLREQERLKLRNERENREAREGGCISSSNESYENIRQNVEYGNWTD